MKSLKCERLALIVLMAGYAVWAGLFIYQSSYIALDGQRYFGLFDDAMISMRYAWNFAHGLGLAWNAGERVEGYTNLLMTLIMSLASLILEKRLAALAIQIMGIPTILGIALLARRLALELDQDRPESEFLGLLTAAAVLLYYPLSYWTLMGMETGLLSMLLLAAVCFGLLWLKRGLPAYLAWMSAMAGLAFLTRNDSLIPSAIIFAFVALVTYWRAHDRGSLSSMLLPAGILALFILAQITFRVLYYGQWLPNTYFLKLTRYPLNIRLLDGSRFVLGFLQQTWPVFLLAAAAIWRRFRLRQLLFILLALAALAYQVYVGGDPWDSWRMLAPAMPALFIVTASGAYALAISLRRRASPALALGAASIVMLVAVAVPDLPFLADMAVRAPTSAAIANRINTNSAIAIQALTSPEATIGVIWAGTLPYYSDRYAIDYLGKSDPYIAHLRADVSGDSAWGGRLSIPGHNKFDLEYSIVQRRPTYSQAFSWGYDTVRPYFVENYVRVEYHGAVGTKTIFLLKDSPLVCWEACKDTYSIVPWPEQK